MADNIIFPSIQPGREAETVATSEGVDRAKLRARIENGECPWCEEPYDNVQAHASQAHPDEWEAYKGDE